MTIAIETKQIKVIILRSLSDFLTTQTGGAQYMSMLFEVLNKHFDVSVEYIYDKERPPIKYFGKLIRFIEMFVRARNKFPDGQIFLLDRKSMFFVKKRPGNKYIGLTHHLSLEEKQNFFNKLFYRLTLHIGFRKNDVIVAVSKYYQDYFTKFGAKTTHVIYNAFEDVKFTDQQIDSFKRKYNISTKQDLIYIGNNRKEKGVLEVYKRLRNKSYTLVTSGPVNETNIPVVHLNLPYREYLMLLASCKAVITMSRQPEGWCRTAHEAMLMRTPVIGNGIAGMKELLDGGKQIICNDFASLHSLLSRLLSNDDERIQMGISGYLFAKQFSKNRFENDWVQLITNLASSI